MTNQSHTELAAQARKFISDYSVMKQPPRLARAIALLRQCAAALDSPERVMGEHRPGCDALGGYGQGVGPCSCGAATPSPQAEKQPLSEADEALMRQALETLRYYASVCGEDDQPTPAKPAITALRARLETSK